MKQNCCRLLQPELSPVGQTGFVVLLMRWVVDRTFGWFEEYRRLVKDY